MSPSSAMQLRDGRHYWFRAAMDAESEKFEDELVAALGGAPFFLVQRHAYLRECAREFRLLQIRDATGKPAFQAVVYITRSRLFGGFAQGIVPRLGPSINGVEEQWGLRLLRRLCAEETDCMALRLQPGRLVMRELWDFEARARREGYRLVDPLDTTRTLFLDLRPEVETMLAALPGRTRQRIRHKGRELVEIRPLTSEADVARCREAENAARDRTKGGAAPTELETLYRIARSHPDRVYTAGMFLKSRPGELLAFSVGARHGKLAEYISAGAFNDPELRSIPYNSFLVWELALWARGHGAEQLDLGGVTEGGPEDPLAGIANFKRQLSENEVEVGREMLIDLRPARQAAFRAIQAVRAGIPR